MKPSSHCTRWDWSDEFTLKFNQTRKTALSLTALLVGRTYGATKTWASTHGFWQMPRWSEDDKSYLAYLLRQSLPFKIIRYSFPDRTAQAIRNQITRLRR